MTWLYVIIAAVAGAAMAGFPAAYGCYKWGNADGRLRERTRNAERRLREQAAERRALEKRDPWVTWEADANLPPAAQRELDQLAPPDAGPYLARQTAPQLQLVTAWDMPARTAWTGPIPQATA